MNKKGIIALVVIIVLVVVGYMVWGGKGTTVTNETGSQPSKETPKEVPAGVSKDDFAPVTKSTTDTSLLGRLKTASVAASETGTRVALVDGKASFSEDGVKGTIALGDVAVEKTVDGVKYVVTTLAVTSAGATNQYVVLFEDKNGSLTDKSYAVVGTKATVTGVRGDVVSGNGSSQLVVSVTYTDAGSKAARTKILVVENGMFNPAKEINL